MRTTGPALYTNYTIEPELFSGFPQFTRARFLLESIRPSGRYSVLAAL